MTQAQQDAVTAAQQKFFAAAAANVAAQKAASDAAAATTAAKTNATVTVPAQCKALQDAANNAYYKSQTDQNAAIQAAQQAQCAQSQAQLDLQNAISDSLQTGAEEMV
ncbi:MAG TPA: hypothetical protein VMH81_13955 [Bryobacteraceae bacterium]|nr:hypothetical protein [Bryobacteraceae bacterium]